ncbi:MAG: YihY/virulence factor BrkB family protein [Pseudomonadota bacterium]
MNTPDTDLVRDEATGAPGQNSTSPWRMPLAAWKQIAVRTWKESTSDNVGLVAAGVAFYSFLAVIPLLGATVLTYGLLTEPTTVVRNMQEITKVMPADVAEMIGEQLLGVVQTSSSKKGFGVFLALAVALFGARNAAGAIISALNIAYEEEEKRGFLKTNLLALAITAGAAIGLAVALLAVGSLAYLHKLLPDANPVALIAWRVASYLLLALAAAGAAAALYRYGPSRDKAKWTWLTPGSLLFALGWAVLSVGFGFYAANVGKFGATYGSLGGVVAVLTWIYLSSYVLLFGAELNSELEHQTKHDTTKGPQKQLGERGAWAADHVAGSADGQA